MPHELLKGHRDNIEKDDMQKQIEREVELKNIANMPKEIEEKYTANPDAAWAELRRACATCATPRAAWTELVAAMSSVKFSQEWTVKSIA